MRCNGFALRSWAPAEGFDSHIFYQLIKNGAIVELANTRPFQGRDSGFKPP